ASATGLDPHDFVPLNGTLLFNGMDASAHLGLWQTDGTVAGTHELTGMFGAYPGGLDPRDLTLASNLPHADLAATGTAGNDSFTALPGSETIDGLGGHDTVTFNF